MCTVPAWCSPAVGPRARRRGVGARARQLQGLQHRLVVLVLVADQHLPHEPVARSGGRSRPTGPRAPARPASARAPRPCSRSRRRGAGRGCRRARPAASRWRRRPCARSGRSGSRPPGALAQPQVLERGDVAQVPHQRAHQRVVHPVQVLGLHRLDQRQRAGAALGQGVAEPALVQRLGPSSGQCLGAMGSHGGYRVVRSGYRGALTGNETAHGRRRRWYVGRVEASRAESAGYLAPSRLTFGELAGCVAALVFALSLFLPWYGTSSTQPQLPAGHRERRGRSRAATPSAPGRCSRSCAGSCWRR